MNDLLSYQSISMNKIFEHYEAEVPKLVETTKGFNDQQRMFVSQLKQLKKDKDLTEQLKKYQTARETSNQIEETMKRIFTNIQDQFGSRISKLEQKLDQIGQIRQQEPAKEENQGTPGGNMLFEQKL